jgi:hypothetical protein
MMSWITIIHVEVDASNLSTRKPDWQNWTIKSPLITAPNSASEFVMNKVFIAKSKHGRN